MLNSPLYILEIQIIVSEICSLLVFYSQNYVVYKPGRIKLFTPAIFAFLRAILFDASGCRTSQATSTASTSLAVTRPTISLSTFSPMSVDVFVGTFLAFVSNVLVSAICVSTFVCGSKMFKVSRFTCSCAKMSRGQCYKRKRVIVRSVIIVAVVNVMYLDKCKRVIKVFIVYNILTPNPAPILSLFRFFSNYFTEKCRTRLELNSFGIELVSFKFKR